ncbi:hypothetical protein LXL04_016426 [Taraxacum kok-saghyz]
MMKWRSTILFLALERGQTKIFKCGSPIFFSGSFQTPRFLFSFLDKRGFTLLLPSPSFTFITDFLLTKLCVSSWLDLPSIEYCIGYILEISKTCELKFPSSLLELERRLVATFGWSSYDSATGNDSFTCYRWFFNRGQSIHLVDLLFSAASRKRCFQHRFYFSYNLRCTKLIKIQLTDGFDILISLFSDQLQQIWSNRYHLIWKLARLC